MNCFVSEDNYLAAAVKTVKLQWNEEKSVICRYSLYNIVVPLPAGKPQTACSSMNII